MLRLQYASDLHLKLAENTRYLKDHPLQVTGDVLVVAGDSHYLGSKECTKHPFWDWASDHYEQVAVIPGNAFGPGGEGFVRACYAASMKDLAEALTRMDNFLTNLKRKQARNGN